MNTTSSKEQIDKLLFISENVICEPFYHEHRLAARTLGFFFA